MATKQDSPENYVYTDKQETYCQKVVEFGNKREAYMYAYNTANMQDNTINTKASAMSTDPKIKHRIDQLRAEALERNRITIDELVVDLANIVRFDIGDMYDEEGRFKSIHDMPKPVRQMISSLDVQELFIMNKGDKMNIGEVKKVKLINKMDAIEKLMKHLGGYERDNKQKQSEVVIYQIPDNGR